MNVTTSLSEVVTCLLQASSASDCLIAWCSSSCSLCQEAREVDIRGGKQRFCCAIIYHIVFLSYAHTSVPSVAAISRYSLAGLVGNAVHASRRADQFPCSCRQCCSPWQSSVHLRFLSTDTDHDSSLPVSS